MTLPGLALKYESCTKAEIWKFCKQRHAPVGKAHRKISKRKCIKALRNLDQQATFPFFSISAELRLMVYPYLLTHDHGGDRKPASEAFPQILRGSKLCYKEARDILYDRSSLTLTILEYDFDVFIGGDIEIFLDRQEYYDGWEYIYLLRRLTKLDNLRNVKVLVMDFNHAHDKPGCSGLSFLLGTIVTSFRTSRALKLLTIKYVCPRFDRIEDVQHATEHEYGIATTEDVRTFEQAVRASSLVQALPTITVLELVDFRKATRKALLALRRDMDC
jgi:hypothetical protein